MTIYDYIDKIIKLRLLDLVKYGQITKETEDKVIKIINEMYNKFEFKEIVECFKWGFDVKPKKLFDEYFDLK